MVSALLSPKFSMSTKAIQRTTLGALLSISLLSGCTAIQTINSPEDTYGVAVTERSLAQRLLDRGIENTALVNINRMDPTLHKRSRISVDSFFSTVLVTGEVPDEQTKQQISSIISSMPDVKQFYNRLNVANAKGASYTVHDGYISSKINAKILANNAISTSQVKIVTDDGVVYAMGKLTPSQRGHLLNIVDSTVGIKELVLLTELIDDNGAPIDENSITQETGLEPPVARYSEAPVAVASTPEQGAQGAQQAQGAQGSNNQAAYSPSTPTSYATPTSPTSSSVVPTTVAPTVAPPQGQLPQSQPPQSQVGTNQGVVAPAANSQDSQPYASPYIEMYKEQVPGW